MKASARVSLPAIAEQGNLFQSSLQWIGLINRRSKCECMQRDFSFHGGFHCSIQCSAILSTGVFYR